MKKILFIVITIVVVVAAGLILANLVRKQSAHSPTTDRSTVAAGLDSQYHDPLLMLSVSYPPDWSLDASQPSCCITLSTTTAALTIFDDTEFTQANDIHTLGQLADRLQLTNRHEISLGGTGGLFGDEPLPTLGGIVDYRHVYILFNSEEHAVEVDLSGCPSSTESMCEQIAQTLRYDTP